VSAYAYDPDDWLVSTHRSISKWVYDQLQADPRFEDNLTVEMSFPDTSTWRKETPLDKILVHFEQDNQEDPILGFGQPGVEVFDDTDPDNPTWTIQEGAQHELNFDVGVWLSAEMGGATKRMEVVQALKNLFTSVYGKRKFNTDTDGLNVVSFTGGRFLIDRVNDIPVWRAIDMTLVVRVFSRHLAVAPVVVPTELDQNESLTIITDDGTAEPI